MSFFEKIIIRMDKFLAPRTHNFQANDELGHLVLLEESAVRVRSAMRAIQEERLVAAVSGTENTRATEKLFLQ